VAVERLVGRTPGEVVERPVDMLAERRRQDGGELLEGRGEVRVVLVGVADHQPGRQDDRHRLAPGQLERRQEGIGLDPPAAALRPEGHPELALDRAEVAVDRPDRRVDPARHLRRLHPVRVGVEQAEDPRHPGQPVALARAALLIHGAMIARAAGRRHPALGDGSPSSARVFLPSSGSQPPDRQRWAFE
jgi:hypothetical protein